MADLIIKAARSLQSDVTNKRAFFDRSELFGRRSPFVWGSFGVVRRSFYSTADFNFGGQLGFAWQSFGGHSGSFGSRLAAVRRPHGRLTVVRQPLDDRPTDHLTGRTGYLAFVHQPWASIIFLPLWYPLFLLPREGPTDPGHQQHHEHLLVH